jgi:hypothetical protein
MDTTTQQTPQTGNKAHDTTQHTTTPSPDHLGKEKENN